jgi:hypothetical protein
MQNIHVRRYKDAHAFQGSIEPEDRSWIVFIDKEGHATFWRRGERELPVGLENMGEVISNEVWYDVENSEMVEAAQAMLHEGAEVPTAEGQQSVLP